MNISECGERLWVGIFVMMIFENSTNSIHTSSCWKGVILIDLFGYPPNKRIHIEIPFEKEHHRLKSVKRYRGI